MIVLQQLLRRGRLIVRFQITVRTNQFQIKKKIFSAIVVTVITKLNSWEIGYNIQYGYISAAAKLTISFLIVEIIEKGAQESRKKAKKEENLQVKY